MPPGKAMTMEQHMLDKGAQMMQSLKPIKHINQHVCTFALYSHDMTRQIETHHYCTRINQDFLQCAVYDSDGRLIGVEYIVSDKKFETLPADEQKLWHSHAYEQVQAQGNEIYGNGFENMDGLNELNRGPRAKISKNQKEFVPVALADKSQNIPFTVTTDDEKLKLNAPD